MKPVTLLVAGLTLASPALAAAQTRIGEFRILGTAASALAPNRADEPPDFPPPARRTMGGVSASLSLTHRNFSLGPEGMVLRGSDRRMYGLGIVGRWGAGRGIVRPFVLLGTGVYGWDRKMVLAFDPSAGPTWVGDLTYLSGSAGGGVVVGTRRLALVLEVRGHKSLTKKEEFGSRDMLSFSGGGRIAW